MPSDSTALAQGKRLFDVSCARCHGIGGAGDFGPPLTRAELRHAPTDSALRDIIQNGIPGTSMPGFFYILDAEADLIAHYVRSLGRVAPEPIAGDPEAGRMVYQRYGCAACHTIDGVGGVVGPELSGIGTRRSLAHLRRSVTDPAASLDTDDRGYVRYLPVRVVTREGRALTGLRVNEDGFSIQLRDLAGRLHTFRKDELRTVEKHFGASVMPSYAGRMSSKELGDLVAYLATRR
jgi:putative heme-binding domain-containing protein